MSFIKLPKNLDNYLKLIIKIGLVLILFLPLLYKSGFYFPFIVPRNLVFRLIVDIILGLYLFLMFKNKAYRFKFNKGFIILFLFVLGLTVSSALGGNFAFAFWSNFERMDGLANWYHIIMYIIVLLGVIRTEKDWQQLFNASLIASWLVALVAIGQRLNFSWLVESYGGVRLTSTIGNAAYVGSYMLLHIILALYLLVIKARKKIWSVLSGYYVLSIAVFFYVLLATRTRGPFLALGLFLFLLAIFYLLFSRKKRTFYYYIIAIVMVLGLTFTGLAFKQKDKAWVKAVPVINKVVSISLTDTTTQSRLFIWRNSLQSVTARPVWGWGEEGFIHVINENFPIEIYRSHSSEIWFDRPHNILVQHLVHGGIVGLGLYLAVFGYLIFALFKRYKKHKRWFFSFFWVAFLLSFLFNDIFIFDNLNTNVIFYLLLAYLFKISVKNKATILSRKIKKRDFIYLLIVLVLISNLFFVFFLKPWRSNRLLISSYAEIVLAKNTTVFNSGLDNWEKSFNMVFLGDKEKVQVLTEATSAVINNPDISLEDKKRLLLTTHANLIALSAKYPTDVRTNVLLSNFYTSFSPANQDFIPANVELLEKLQASAPYRPDLYISLTNAYLTAQDFGNAKATALALVNLAPWAPPVYWNELTVGLYSKDIDMIKNSLDNIVTINNELYHMNFDYTETSKLEILAKQAHDIGDEDIASLLDGYLAISLE